MIIALTAISGCSEISYLNINFMAKTEGKYIFSFNKLTKVWHRGKSQPSLGFEEFEQKKILAYCFSTRYLYRAQWTLEGGPTKTPVAVELC